jgi:hypothetical protein
VDPRQVPVRVSSLPPACPQSFSFKPPVAADLASATALRRLPRAGLSAVLAVQCAGSVMFGVHDTGLLPRLRPGTGRRSAGRGRYCRPAARRPSAGARQASVRIVKPSRPSRGRSGHGSGSVYGRFLSDAWSLIPDSFFSSASASGHRTRACTQSCQFTASNGWPLAGRDGPRDLRRLAGRFTPRGPGPIGCCGTLPLPGPDGRAGPPPAPPSASAPRIGPRPHSGCRWHEH